MSLDELTNQQADTGAEIERCIRNYKKDSDDRKTQIYLEQRTKLLGSLWENFHKTDHEIRNKYVDQGQHAYFTKDYFGNVSNAYQWFVNDANGLKAQLKALSERKHEEKPEDSESPSVPSSSKGNPTTLSTLRRLKAATMSLDRTLSTINKLSETESSTVYQVKSQTIERYWSNIEKLHEVLWENTDDPSAAGFNIEEYFALQDVVEKTIIELRERSIETSGQVKREFIDNSPQIKLPTITSPKFDGNYLNWRPFHDLFIQMVHKQNLGNVQKMWYLKTSLTGEAERLIHHLNLSDDNYLSAWNMLKDRYDNIRLLVAALLNKLLGQSAIHIESAVSIKSLHDVTKECLMSLKNLQIFIENWDPLLLHLLIKKLDTTTHSLYEQSLSQPKELQSLQHFLNFLEKRFQSLESLGVKPRQMGSNIQRSILKSLATTTASSPCIACKGEHQLFACSVFLKMTPEKRLRLVQGARHCVNCLKSGHGSNVCTSRQCLKCSKKHNTLLHLEKAINVPKSQESIKQQPTSNASANPVARSNQQTISLSANSLQPSGSYVLLSTAIVMLTDKCGNKINARAILDSGSQINFITESLVKRLGIRVTKQTMCIEGIGQRRQDTQRRVNIQIHSNITGFKTNIEAHILPKIISQQPNQKINISSWSIPKNIKLADPQFYQPASIDILIGAELFYSILAVGQIKLGNELPILQNTVFGWTVAGRMQNSISSPNSAYCGICSEDESLGSHIQRFWQLEEAEKQTNNYTLAESKCENLFVQTTKRISTGRIMVKLPFRDDPTKLGDSSETALRRFHSIERRIMKNPELKQQYVQFMKEYLDLGHMEEICFSMVEEPYFLLPHHCVLKPENTTTKLRVVFDGSAKTTSNLSLNDVLATGPAIQDDVFTILLRFRMPCYVFTADIEKMYRQILVDPADRKYQLIWWRDEIDKPLKCYALNTVTYGTAPASYLAIRSLHKLANDVQRKYPLAAQVLQHNVYVDDVMSGSNQIRTALQMQSEIISSLKTAGIKIRKWCANHPQLLQNIPPGDQAIEVDFTSQTSDAVKTIGLTWQPKSDSLSIRSELISHQRITKRTASSDIAHIFDPLGILSPGVITAKLFLQRLWELKLDWDAALPQDLHTKWLKFREGLKTLNNISFPRHVFSHKIPKMVELHIFADASEKAYGAAAYIRAVTQNNTVIVRLLCVKSKLAPIKQITLPRLELCAAKLATQLMQRIKKDIHLENEKVFLWTDSMIVLGWIHDKSSNFHTFVANRISAIQQISIPEQWRHVKSTDNPAHLLSRGVSPEALAAKNLWFYGPKFLYGIEKEWPQPYTEHLQPTLERRDNLKSVFAAMATNLPTTIFEIIDHRNSFRRLQRIVAYMQRFINNCRTTTKKSVEELDNSQAAVVKHMQQRGFADDIKQLHARQKVSARSSINSLTPFLDERGILRVGGRLSSSTLSFNAKHPMLLPYAHPFSRLIFFDIHKENKHVAEGQLLSITRETLWPIRGKTLAKAVVHHCVQCARTKPRFLSQLMGNLPADRVQPARPFIIVGVDFCGPVFTHFKIRGKKPQKAYIAVFCCFATKAVHLELVSDLTTEGFVGALRRFISRRGHCKKIYCDNATNFVAARNQLSELHTSIYNYDSKQKIPIECTSKGIDFNFIPHRAPHFGGLWEAAEKSAKHLLKHTLSSASLTYEEMETVVIEAEAILNSRPITPLSDNPNDLAALTPAHFLIGETLTSIVDPQSKPINTNLLTRWKLVTYVKNEFWKRWSKEYLNQLQHRYKWKHPCPNGPGTMVIIKDDNLPPLKWPLGRIVNAIKGEDGLVRVVDVQTANNLLRRPIHRLAPLPTDKEVPEIASQTPEGVNSTINQINDLPQRPVPNPTKRPKLSLGSALVTILLACLIIPAKGVSPATVTPFKTNPGLYFENMGGANIINSEWNIVTYYDMQQFWKELDLLHNCSSTLSNISATMRNPGPYISVASQIKHVITELDEANELLQPPGSQRTKRGAINIVGNVASALFGVLDSKYAEEMSATIDSIHQNEKNVVALVRNQTSILDATINVMKRNHQAIETELKRVDSYLNRISSQVDAIRDEKQEKRMTQRLSGLTFQTLLTITNFQRSQNLILDALANTYQGKLSRHLISPRQLKNVLSTIRSNLPSTLKIPLSTEDILKLYNLMSLEGRMTNKHIIFKLRLPLISSEDYELFRLIPVPVKVNNSFIAIRPSSPFLVVNLHRQHYYPLLGSELTTCLSIDGKHFCKPGHPLYNIGSSVSACEIKLLNRMETGNFCPIMKMDYQSTWIQMQNPNNWIYSLKEKTTINIVCGENRTQLVLQDAGMLAINSDCIIKQPLLTIHGHTLYNSTNRLSYIPLINLTDIVTWHNLTHLPRYQHHYSPNIDELDAIKQQIQDINMQLPDVMVHVQKHQYAWGYFSLTIISSIVIFYIWKSRCAVRSSSALRISQPVNEINKEGRANHSDTRFTIDLATQGIECSSFNAGEDV